ncbi:MAG: DUF3795 domain-containing protein [Anaerolineales bacterium]|nr:DUF3795 domain-containing protein [Anaerolineales bacterium]
MDPILTRCGYRCDLCLAYRPNVERNPANQQKLSDGWFKYFGFRLPPETIFCDGCMAVGNPHLIDSACPVRPCVLSRGLENCAGCEDYICEKLAERLVDFESLLQKAGGAISEEDRACFLFPYENRPRLETIRSSKGMRIGE